MIRLSVDDKVYVPRYEQAARVARLLDGIAIVEFKSGERAKVPADELKPGHDPVTARDFDSATSELVEDFRQEYDGDYMTDLVTDICGALKDKLFEEG